MFSPKRQNEGIISARLFTPGERKPLAKSKVLSWVAHLTDLINVVVCQEWDKFALNV
jgi:hypothetical protein